MQGLFSTNRDRNRDQEYQPLTMQSRKSYGMPIQSDIAQPSLKKKRSARVVSLILTILLSGAAAAFTFLPQFRVMAPEVSSSDQINMEEIIYYTGLRDIPIYQADPGEISDVLLKRYPQTREINVSVEMPASVKIDLIPRMPIIEWDFGGSKIWIDDEGMVLQGQYTAQSDLIYVLSNSFPGAKNKNDRKFPQKFSNKMLESLIQINQAKPQDKTLYFTYDNGYGWQLDKGYTLWIGIDNTQLDEKMKMAESLETYFTENEIEPEMLSLEFTQAPYFRFAE